MDRWHFPRDPLLALQQGDPGPFEQLVRAHARTLIAFFRQRGATLGRAEDLTQEVFLKLFRGARRYRSEERFSAFFFRVARNVWIDACRRRGLIADSSAGSAPEATDEPDDLPAPPADPAAELMTAEEDRGLRRLLGTLPETHRAVFELAVLGDLGYAEIAALLGIPEGTVKSRMFYAVRRLRLALEERRGEEGVA
jgi:RNA polymerase sigma-70 factor (ECF subfamily)